MKKINVSIIGTGGISHIHMNGYKAIEGVDVVAVCDIDEEKVKAYAARYNVPRYYTDYSEMLEKEELDCVSVCTWNSEHKNATIAALNAGANVLCEKPMAMNQEEALEMEKAAKDNNKLLMIGFVRRFGNDTDIIKRFIEAGDMGDIYYAKASYLRRNGTPGGWFADKRYSGGGPLIDLGVHVIDLVRYLAGNPLPVSAYGVSYGKLRDKEVAGDKAWKIDSEGAFEANTEDFAAGFVKFENGLTLYIEASFNLHIKHDVGSVELFGTKSGAKIDPHVHIFTDLNDTMVDIEPSDSSAFDFGTIFNKEIYHFVDCVRTGKTCISPAEDGVVLMKIIDALYESARTNKEVKISI